MANPAQPAQFPIAQRDAFLIPSGPGAAQDQCHFFVVLTDPAKNDSVLLVNATTYRGNLPHDASCFLDVGDHPFIRHKSYILYSKPHRATLQRLRTLIASGAVTLRPPPVSHAVFARIEAGTSSNQMTPDDLDFYQRFK